MTTLTRCHIRILYVNRFDILEIWFSTTVVLISQRRTFYSTWIKVLSKVLIYDAASRYKLFKRRILTSKFQLSLHQQQPETLSQREIPALHVTRICNIQMLLIWLYGLLSILSFGYLSFVLCSAQIFFLCALGCASVYSDVNHHSFFVCFGCCRYIRQDKKQEEAGY